MEGQCYCVSPPSHTYNASLLTRSWLVGDVKRKVCLCILPAPGQRAPTHVHAPQTHTDAPIRSLRCTHTHRHTNGNVDAQTQSDIKLLYVYTNTLTSLPISPALCGARLSPPL